MVAGNRNDLDDIRQYLTCSGTVIYCGPVASAHLIIAAQCVWPVPFRKTERTLGMTHSLVTDMTAVTTAPGTSPHQNGGCDD
jgi:hypothetical protein